MNVLASGELEISLARTLYCYALACVTQRENGRRSGRICPDGDRSCERAKSIFAAGTLNSHPSCIQIIPTKKGDFIKLQTSVI